MAKTVSRKRSLVEMEEPEVGEEMFEESYQPSGKKGGGSGYQNQLSVLSSEEDSSVSLQETGDEVNLSDDVPEHTLTKVEVKQQAREMPTDEGDGEYYEILGSNEFADESVDPDEVKSKLQFWCNCPMPPKGETGCLTGCDNREKRVECDLALCKAGDQCGNRAVQLGGSEKVAITEEFGGSKLIAVADIPAGSYLAQYTGQLVTKEGLEERLAELYRPDQRIHVLPLNKVWVLDATTKGSMSRLATHSCAPNVIVEAWLVEGMDCLAMFSFRDLRANESITFDHSSQMELLGACKRCSCGARSCRKLLGGTAHCDSGLLCSICQARCGGEGRVDLHPALATPVCQPCRQSWLQSDFSRLLTTGKESVCRWCARSGGTKVVSCVTCRATFCKKCLKVNLGANYIKLAETGSWTCLVCDTRPLDKLRGQLLADGEQRKEKRKDFPVPSQVPMMQDNSSIKSPAPLRPRIPKPTPPRSLSTRPKMEGQSPGYRNIVRPRTPGVKSQMPSRFSSPTCLPRPRTAAPRNPFPRLVGQTNVTIERVARPTTPPAPPARNIAQTSAIINQLQRYSGLSIKPVSESVSQLDGIISEVKVASKILQEAVMEAEKGKKEDKISKSKDKLAEEIKAAKAKLSYIESKLM